MTGFGEAAAESSELRVEARVHGVNHRFLDLVVRLPDELRFAEGRIRERVGRSVRRGRCEVAVVLRRRGDAAGAEFVIEHEALAVLHRAARPLLEKGLLASGLSLGDLLRTPALLRIETPRFDDAGDSAELLWRVLDDALAAFDRRRADEGACLRAALRGMARELTELTAALRAAAPAAAERLGDQLRQRMHELAHDVGGGDERWLHEAAALVEKADVREEVERLSSHLTELERVLDAPGPVGRRIDFLAQELLRELNTLAAKCREVAIVRIALDARLVSEQIREQAQNVE